MILSTDRWTDDVKPVYPNFVEAGGIMTAKLYCFKMQGWILGLRPAYLELRFACLMLKALQDLLQKCQLTLNFSPQEDT